MTVLSVFGASPPPGAYTLFDDGAPSIRLAHAFYRYGGLIDNAATIIGGRVWLPSAPAGSTQIRIMLWAGVPITAAPTQQVVVNISGTGWQEGLFPVPQAIPGDGVNFRIGYDFVGNDDNYVFTSDLRLDQNNQSIPNNGIALSELKGSFSSPIGAAEASPAGYNIGYGVDVLIDDGTAPSNLPPTAYAGIDQSVAFGDVVTLTGAASDSDGTVASTGWQQISGGVVTLAGTGLTRTFTASSSGVLVFRFTATDDAGASTNDTVTVVVASPPLQRAATSSGALKALIESGGLKISAYRDAVPEKSNLPAITIDENVATSQERHGDVGDPLGHHGESELLFVHLWELWRKPDGMAGERYELIRGLKRLLRTAPGFVYGPDDAPVRVYGLQITGHVRIVEDEENVVHHTVTITMRRDT